MISAPPWPWRFFTMAGDRARFEFPTTHWSRIVAARDRTTAEARRGLGCALLGLLVSALRVHPAQWERP